MCSSSIFVWTLLYLVSSCVAEIFQRPCDNTSPECLKESLQLAIPSFIEGAPKLGLETLDPYYIKKLDLVLPGGIKIKFTNGYATGLKHCIVDYARLEGDIFKSQFHCNLTIRGKYKSKGRMLLFTIDGDGDSEISCHNLRINSILKLSSKVGRDGQKYLKIENSKITHSFDGKVTYNMTNLFKRDPEMDKDILEFMNKHWRMIAEDFGEPMVDYGAKCVMRNLKKLLRDLPLDKILKGPVDV